MRLGEKLRPLRLRARLTNQYIPLGDSISENGQSETLSSITLEAAEIVLRGHVQNIGTETLLSRSSLVQFGAAPIEQNYYYPLSPKDSIFGDIEFNQSAATIGLDNLVFEQGSNGPFAYDFTVRIPYNGPFREALQKDAFFLVEGVVTKTEARIHYTSFHYASLAQIQNRVAANTL